MPIAQPPGSAILALPYFARRGPRTKIDALIVFTSSYLASMSLRLHELIVKSIFSSRSISEPIDPSNSKIVVMSCKYGRFFKVIFSSHKMVAAIIGSAAFFAPEHLMFPDRVLPPFISSFSIINYIVLVSKLKA